MVLAAVNHSSIQPRSWGTKSVAYERCDLGHVTSPLWAPGSSLVSWGKTILSFHGPRDNSLRVFTIRGLSSEKRSHLELRRTPWRRRARSSAVKNGQEAGTQEEGMSEVYPPNKAGGRGKCGLLRPGRGLKET